MKIGKAVGVDSIPANPTGKGKYYEIHRALLALKHDTCLPVAFKDLQESRSVCQSLRASFAQSKARGGTRDYKITCRGNTLYIYLRQNSNGTK